MFYFETVEKQKRERYKVPGINDKISIPMSARMRQWCEQWDAVWKDE